MNHSEIVAKYEEHNCPICLEKTHYTVETACNHHFCAKCLLQSWQKSKQNRIYTCPMCRKPILWLRRLFQTSEVQAEDICKDVDEKLNHFINSQSELETALIRASANNNDGFWGFLKRPSSISMNIFRGLVISLTVIYLFLPSDSEY